MKKFWIATGLSVILLCGIIIVPFNATKVSASVNELSQIQQDVNCGEEKSLYAIDMANKVFSSMDVINLRFKTEGFQATNVNYFLYILTNL